MTVSTVTSSADPAFLSVLRKYERARLVFIKRPQMILFIEVCLAAFCFIFLERNIEKHLKSVGA